MARMNYGPVNNISSAGSQLGNVAAGIKAGNIVDNSNNSVQAARVTYIMLDDSDRARFSKYGGWNGIGTIEYQLISNPATRGIAYPSNSNLKTYPLLNEIVYLVRLPSSELTNKNSTKLYYITNINIWNHPHHNGYPLLPNSLPPEQRKDYQQIESGSVRRITDQSTEINLGKTFKERPNIHPLLMFEGDVIHEGRWGNSIRLGSTVNNSPSSISNKWSEIGENGDPLIVIRNGQGLQTDEGWIPVTEDINNDNSSIYLTYTQKIPIEAASIDYTSYSDSPPILPDQFSDKPQIILNSGRLLFNSYEDHILLSSVKSINLNSQTSVNVDSKKFVIQADKIFLGKEELATEPLLKGNATVSLLRNLIESLEILANALKTAQTSPTVPGTPASLPSINLNASLLSATLKTLKNNLNTITSERNFTL